MNGINITLSDISNSIYPNSPRLHYQGKTPKFFVNTVSVDELSVEFPNILFSYIHYIWNKDKLNIHYIMDNDYILPIYQGCVINYVTLSPILNKVFYSNNGNVCKLIFDNNIYYGSCGNIFTEDFTPLVFYTAVIQKSNEVCDHPTFYNYFKQVKQNVYINPIVFTDQSTKINKWILKKYIPALLTTTIQSNYVDNRITSINVIIENAGEKFIKCIKEPVMSTIDQNSIINDKLQSIIDNYILPDSI